jgi:hypothetical protein
MLPVTATLCPCQTDPAAPLDDERYLGMDRDFADVTLRRCSRCGQAWLHYLYEMEAVTASGRWFRGAVADERAGTITAVDARQVLGTLPWYWKGGSYFGGTVSRGSGEITLGF